MPQRIQPEAVGRVLMALSGLVALRLDPPDFALAPAATDPFISRSFREGFEAGWTMTLITTGGFLLVGLPSSPGGALFELNRAMIRPLTLLILGYMLAREGGVQRRARHQVALLAQLNTITNPRFGVDRTLLNAAERIRAAYGIQHQ